MVCNINGELGMEIHRGILDGWKKNRLFLDLMMNKEGEVLRLYNQETTATRVRLFWGAIRSDGKFRGKEAGNDLASVAEIGFKSGEYTWKATRVQWHGHLCV